MSDGKSKSSGQVRSLTRALTMLRHLAESGDGMSLTELSEAASLPPSTTHRLLTTLESERFVRPDPQGGLWRVGVAAFFVGTAFARSRDKLTLARNIGPKSLREIAFNLCKYGFIKNTDQWLRI